MGWIVGWRKSKNSAVIHISFPRKAFIRKDHSVAAVWKTANYFDLTRAFGSEPNDLGKPVVDRNGPSEITYLRRRRYGICGTAQSATELGRVRALASQAGDQRPPHSVSAAWH